MNSYRSHNCGALRDEHVGESVVLSGWVQKIRNLGGMTFIDLRDRYGITQIVFDMETNADLCARARDIGREYVIRVEGKVQIRSNKNKNIPTGDIEITGDKIDVLNASKIPPFTIENESDGGDELRMKYRYLDLRRSVVKDALILRHKMAHEIRRYLVDEQFLEIETPVLIKSTPEGARDFVVPSRLNPGQFYALPQSPQTFKQLLMIGGFDRYFQIVRCFRDEDLRADRQPEFTQVDCEMSFVDQEDVLNTFEGLVKHLLKNIRGIELQDGFLKLSYEEAMNRYGTDKPDLRFGMEISEISEIVKGKGFKVFDSVPYIGGICAKGLADYSRKELDALTAFVTKPQIGAKGLVYVKCNQDGTFKSSVDKFYDQQELQKWAEAMGPEKGDLLLILAGDKKKTLTALSELRLEMANRQGLQDENTFVPLWIVDFPLFEWDDETNRFYAMHHPFTAPKDEDVSLFDSYPGKIRAKAYDLVINGVEIGGGSVRIHNRQVQEKLFQTLGFSEDEAKKQFGFLMDAFTYGAPPHAGIAFGFDRLVSLFAGFDSIRDVIAFPKNNNGRDVMINAPDIIDEEQVKSLHLKLNIEQKKPL